MTITEKEKEIFLTVKFSVGSKQTIQFRDVISVWRNENRRKAKLFNKGYFIFCLFVFLITGIVLNLYLLPSGGHFKNYMVTKFVHCEAKKL